MVKWLLFCYRESTKSSGMLTMWRTMGKGGYYGGNFSWWTDFRISVWLILRVSNLESRETMMTSSNGKNFRVTGPLCGKFTGHRWIPRTKASDAELWCFLWSAPWINGWVSNRETGDLRRHRAHYDVIVMNHRSVMCSVAIRCLSLEQQSNSLR